VKQHSWKENDTKRSGYQFQKRLFTKLLQKYENANEEKRIILESLTTDAEFECSVVDLLDLIKLQFLSWSAQSLCFYFIVF
jgi:hypothetical protein